MNKKQLEKAIDQTEYIEGKEIEIQEVLKSKWLDDQRKKELIDVLKQDILTANQSN